MIVCGDESSDIGSAPTFNTPKYGTDVVILFSSIKLSSFSSRKSLGMPFVTNTKSFLLAGNVLSMTTRTRYCACPIKRMVVRRMMSNNRNAHDV
jgi:hypothetical protein